jgi:WD40 repeat protein/tRNA A-37 threonylcarbamoyl transferase component Bud32
MADDLDDLADPERRLCEVLAAYFEAVKAGTAPERGAWLATYPDLASPLADFLDERDRLLDLTEPLREIAGAAVLGAAQGHGVGPLFFPTADAQNGNRVARDVNTVAGRLFGDYELIDEIARGGMGIVYKARQTSLNRLVALKMLRTSALVDADSPRRFRLEAEATANLDHPNIVPIYDVGECDGFSYFAMKLVDGGSLAQHLAAYTADPRAAAQLVATVARAVHHAHQRGVLHRDLKPSNIVIDAAGQPHVTDFGLAKRVEGDSELTQSGAILGTPSYMAPEQASGEKKAVSTATDVYGLGAVLYALLTGKPPFRGDSVLETLDQVRQMPPEPPSGIVRQMDRDLEAICLKCLEKEPEGRYPSALALAEDLERWLAGKPTLARPLSRPARLRRWASRRWKRLAAAAVGLVMLGLIGMGVAQGMRLRRADRLLDAQRLAILQRDDAARLTQYVSDIRRAATLLAGGDRRKARDLLEEQGPTAGRDDLRGFEWSYLWGHVDASAAAWSAHGGGEVYHVEYAPDGRRLASAGADGTARVWDAHSQRELLVLRGHDADVNWVSFDPNGRRLVTAGEDGKARIWDGSDGSLLATLDSLAQEVVVALFTPDGRDVIAATRDGLVVRWDAATGDKRATLKHDLGDSSVEALAISSQGTNLALTALLHINRGNVLILHNIGDGGLTAAATIKPLGSNCVAFAPDGTALAVTGSRGQHVGIYEGVTGNLQVTLAGVTDHPFTVAYSPDGRTLAVGHGSGALRLWDLESRTCRATLQGHTDGVWCVTYSPDGRTIATTSRDGTIRLWDAMEYANPLTFRGAAQNRGCIVESVAVSGDGTRVVAATKCGDILECKLATRTTRAFDLLDHKRVLWDFARISPHGAHLLGYRLTSHAPRPEECLWDVVLLDLAGGQKSVTLAESVQTRGPPVWSPDGEKLALVDGAGELALWDVNGHLLGRLKGRLNSGSSGLAFLPGDDLIIAWCRDTASEPRRSFEFITWEPARSRLNRRTELGLPPAGPVVASPDGRTLAGRQGRIATLWDLSTLALRHELVGHHEEITGLAFAPDGRTLATASLDRTVRLWNVASGQDLLVLEGHAGPVRALAFSADGSMLATCGDGPADREGTIEMIEWRALHRSLPNPVLGESRK